MHRKKLKDAPAALIALLGKLYAYETHEMHRETFDPFDFPGTSPHAFDLLKGKYEALSGNHRNGFNVTPTAIKFLSKLPPVPARIDAYDAFIAANR